MRALLPDPVEDVDVHAFYAADWAESGGLRVNFVASVDGAAHAEGRSAGLQTPGDNRVFAALRDLADVVLVGAGTAVIEGYRAIRVSPARVECRRRFGFAPVLPTAVISRTLRLDPGAPLFTDVVEGARTIVLTTRAAPPKQREAVAEVADLVVCGDETVDPVAARAALEERELLRILAEGGPTVFAEWAAAGVVDELCLTLTPMLAGPGAGRIVAGDRWPTVGDLTLAGVLEEDAALFLRYRMPGTMSPRS